MMRTLLPLLLLLLPAALACSSDLDCGSGDASAPGLCRDGVCQCGVGYAGNRPIDPTACTFSCAPEAVPDSVAFLREPNVTVGASGGNLVLEVQMAPYAKQMPATVALLNPVNGSACPLMPDGLGLGVWTQTLLLPADQCRLEYEYAAAFGETVAKQCWQQLGSSTEAGSQYSITFQQYQTQVEVIQQGLAPFGQTATRQALDEVAIRRAFRRDYTISVATQFRPTSAPFSLVAEPPVGPTAVDDTVTTAQNQAVTAAVLGNDIAGYQNVDGVQQEHPLIEASVSIEQAPAHGSVSIVEGAIIYTPAALYHGPDSFSYQVCDSVSLCDAATVLVTVLPDGPVAADDAAQCAFESAVTVEILNNDVARVGGLVTVTIVAQPESGSATVNEDKTITYTAATGFSGLVSLQYEVCDGSNPTVLCDTATVQIDVDGTGPVAVNDVASVGQSEPAGVSIDVLDNDLAGTEALNASTVRVTLEPEHGSAVVNAADGSITYIATSGYHGQDQLRYEVCDQAQPPKCASANVTVTVTPRGPQAVDDAASTSYATSVTVAVLANDSAGAEPLNTSSVTIVSGAATVNAADGSITVTPGAGFVGSLSITYRVCDVSIPTPLCDEAQLTVVVQPRVGGSIQYRLVEIDYDIIGDAIVATVQTRTVAGGRVGGVQLDAANSTGLSSVLSGPASGGCDASSPAGFCDQFHVVRFSDEPCAVSNAEMVLTAQFVCSDGSAPESCGFQSGQQSSFRLDRLFLTYDACPRVVEYGINAAASFLRLHEDAPRATPIAAPATQGETLYGRCSVEPSAGATFEAVTLSALRVFQQSAGGPIDLGNQLSAPFMTLLSSATSTSASNPQWDFDVLMEPTFFSVTESYFLEATLELTFANTGPLTRKLVLPLARRANQSSLRSALSDASRTELVAITGRAPDARVEEQGVQSNKFAVRAAAATSGAEAAAAGGGSGEAASNGGGGSSSNTAMIAGIAGGVAGVVVVAACVIIAVVIKKRRRRGEEGSEEGRSSETSMTADFL